MKPKHYFCLLSMFLGTLMSPALLSAAQPQGMSTGEVIAQLFSSIEKKDIIPSFQAAFEQAKLAWKGKNKDKLPVVDQFFFTFTKTLVIRKIPNPQDRMRAKMLSGEIARRLQSMPPASPIVARVICWGLSAVTLFFLIRAGIRIKAKFKFLRLMQIILEIILFLILLIAPFLWQFYNLLYRTSIVFQKFISEQQQQMRLGQRMGGMSSPR